MPAETIAVLVAVVTAFTVFGLVLANASRETERLLREEARKE